MTRAEYTRIHFSGPHLVRACTPEEDATMERMRVEGASLAQIATAMGRSKSTVQMALLRMAKKAEGAEP